jgi:hypothetical protein
MKHLRTSSTLYSSRIEREHYLRPVIDLIVLPYLLSRQREDFLKYFYFCTRVLPAGFLPDYSDRNNENNQIMSDCISMRQNMAHLLPTVNEFYKDYHFQYSNAL